MTLRHIAKVSCRLDLLHQRIALGNNSVWHDFDININNDDDVVLLLRNGKIVDYDDDWEEYYSPAVKWAYKKDLLPNTENN